MQNRIFIAFAALLAVAAPCIAQLTPISGSRGISGNVRNSAGVLNSYSNAAPFDLETFNDSRHVGSGGAVAQLRIESSLTSTLWLIEGSGTADAMFASPGLTATASSSVNLSLNVEAGTYLQVFCLSGGSYGGMTSRVQMYGAGLAINISGGQNYVTHSQNILVTEASTIGITASGGASASSGGLPRSGYYEVMITATTVPAPPSLGVLALAVAGCFTRRRRVG